MSNPKSLWERLSQGRVVRILAVYLGASWAVLQVSSMVVDAFKLPEWVMPSAIILLLIGLVIVVATAWVQSLASTTAGEEAGALPTNWEIAPRDALASLRRGRLPHLTWGRVVIGGVVMLSLLFGGAGTYVGFMRGGLGPSPASASEALEGIAVVPFEVTGQSLDISGDGMMTLLANGLDGVGGFRTIDTRTVMARWNDKVGDDGTADLAATLAVAHSTGARYLLQGSVVALGTSVRLAASVYDIDSGKQVASGQVEGSAADVMRLVDQLAVGTMRSLLKSVGRTGATAESTETITTTSLPAMRAYLEGEAHYRHGRFADAVQSYENAVAADSTFAIALVRLAEAYGWLENSNSKRMLEVGKRATAQAHRLSPRYQFLITGWDALNRLSPDGIPSLKEAVRKYPDDPTAWFLLAETYIHVGGATYGTADELWHALEQAHMLDPTFAPYLVHVAEYAVIRGDRAKAEESLAQYEKAGGKLDDVSHIQLAIPLILGTAAEADSALRTAPQMSTHAIDSYGGTFARKHDHFERDAVMDAVLAKAISANRANMQGYYIAATGALARAGALLKDPAVGPVDRAIYPAYVWHVWNVQPPAGAIPVDGCGAQPGTLCSVIIGTAFAGLGRWSDHERVITMMRDGARAATDTAVARRMNATAEVLRGVGLHRRGDTSAARDLLTRYATSEGTPGEYARRELAWLEAEANRPAEAIRHFQTVVDGFSRPDALYGLASMHEKLGQPDSARIYWSRLVTLTEKGEALPRIVEARNALARGAKER